jgi:hypothetical protein
MGNPAAAYTGSAARVVESAPWPITTSTAGSRTMSAATRAAPAGSPSSLKAMKSIGAAGMASRSARRMAGKAA